MKYDMKFVPANVLDPKINMLADMFNQLEDTKKMINKLGEQVIYTVDHVNQTKAYMTVLSYLFAHGVSAFAFQKMILIAPNEVRSYVKTDQGLFAVHIREENEMMKVESVKFQDEKEYYTDMKGWLTLLAEKAPESTRPSLRKEIEAIPI